MCPNASDEARAAGAPHLRRRVFIVAYPQSARQQTRLINGLRDVNSGVLAATPARGSDVAYTESQQDRRIFERQLQSDFGASSQVCDAASERLPDWAGGEMGQPSPLTEFERPSGREIERNFRGVAYGVSRRTFALRALGNAVVPQVAEYVFRRIVEVEAS